MRHHGPFPLREKLWCGLALCLIIAAVLISGSYPVYGAEDNSSQPVDTGNLLAAADKEGGEAKPSPKPESIKPSGEYGDVTEKDLGEKPSDEYGNVSEGEGEGEGAAAEGAQISDPIEPWNRAMYHFNDKLYFWALKPVAQGWGYIVPEDVRGLIGNFYQNIRAPIRIVNNLLQARPADAGREFARLLINSTVGVAGLRDCAKECFGITGRDADFGQTLGKYGLGFGIYLVWPFIGPSSARDSVGFAVDWGLSPTTYVVWPESAKDDLINPLSIILYAHNKINYTSFHIGDYEALKAAAIDPYVAMRDFYAQYRKKMIKD